MKNHTKNNKLIVILVMSVLSLCLAAGGTYAWFTNLNRLNSISLVQIPSKITISGSNRSEMTRINLELTDNDTQVGTTVTINRVFCIESTDDFLIEIARTTNISNMDIKIFPVSVADSEKSTGEKANGWVFAGEGADAMYYKGSGSEIAGAYLNLDESTQIAIQKGVSGSLHDENYSTGDEVQKNAEPLFWLSTSVEDYNLSGWSRSGKAADGVTDIFYRYYILQLTWDAASQETDLVYLMASHQEIQ